MLALSKAWEEGRDVELVELFHQGSTSPSSLEQGQHPAEQNPEPPTSLSDEDKQYKMFQREEATLQSDGRNEIFQVDCDPAEPLETMPDNREAHRAHDADSCGTIDKTTVEVPLLQNTLPSTSSAEPSENVLERLGKLKVPTKVKPRGRPKGAEKTVIGLPRRRQGPRQAGREQATKLQPFRDLPLEEKDSRILRCLIAQGLLGEVLQGKILVGEFVK